MSAWRRIYSKIQEHHCNSDSLFRKHTSAPPKEFCRHLHCFHCVFHVAAVTRGYSIYYLHCARSEPRLLTQSCKVLNTSWQVSKRLQLPLKSKVAEGACLAAGVERNKTCMFPWLPAHAEWFWGLGRARPATQAMRREKKQWTSPLADRRNWKSQLFHYACSSSLGVAAVCKAVSDHLYLALESPKGWISAAQIFLCRRALSSVCSSRTDVMLSSC